MIPEYAWFERTFTFDLPVWLFPNILERLRGTPARLEELVSAVEFSRRIRRDGDEWSIQENAGHLWDLESLWLGRVEDFFADRATLRAADLSNRRTHEANHNAARLEDILAGFRRERLILVERLDPLEEADVRRSALHPRLQQPMTLIDHAFFVAEHDDHHLAQITRLKRRFAQA